MEVSPPSLFPQASKASLFLSSPFPGEECCRTFISKFLALCWYTIACLVYQLVFCSFKTKTYGFLIFKRHLGKQVNLACRDNGQGRVHMLISPPHFYCSPQVRMMLHPTSVHFLFLCAQVADQCTCSYSHVALNECVVCNCVDNTWAVRRSAHTLVSFLQRPLVPVFGGRCEPPPEPTLWACIFPSSLPLVQPMLQFFRKLSAGSQKWNLSSFD